jgi:hypothetical protein
MWYREAAEPMALLDATFEGLTDEDDGALRDFSAEAAREFLLWSAKHVTAKTSQAGANLNAASLLRRLFERLAHPKPYQRCCMLTLGIPCQSLFVTCSYTRQRKSHEACMLSTENPVLCMTANSNNLGAIAGQPS